MHYSNSHVFDPERFDPDTGGIKEFKEKGAYMPFGDGPRICLGIANQKNSNS